MNFARSVIAIAPLWRTRRLGSPPVPSRGWHRRSDERCAGSADHEHELGLTYGKLGQQEEARITLERVISEWPDSVEADVARKEMAKYSPTGDRDLEP